MKIINLKFSLSSLLLSSSIFHEISSERQKLTQKQKLKALKNEFKVLNIQYGMLYDEMLKLNATIDGHLNVHTQNELKSKDVDTSIETMETRLDDCKLAQANIEAALRSKADLKATNEEFENFQEAIEQLSAIINYDKEQARNFEQATNDRFEGLVEQQSLIQTRNEQLESSYERLSARTDGFLHQLLVLDRGWVQAGNTPVYFKELSDELYPVEELTPEVWTNNIDLAHRIIDEACSEMYDWVGEVIPVVPGVARGALNPIEHEAISSIQYSRFAICELRLGGLF